MELIQYSYIACYAIGKRGRGTSCVLGLPIQDK